MITTQSSPDRQHFLEREQVAPKPELESKTLISTKTPKKSLPGQFLSSTTLKVKMCVLSLINFCFRIKFLKLNTGNKLWEDISL